jgi:hypothetical protein
MFLMAYANFFLQAILLIINCVLLLLLKQPLTYF